MSGSSGDLLRRLRLRRSARGLRERPHDCAARKIDLERVGPVTLGVAQQYVRRAGKSRRARLLAVQGGLSLGIAPRLGRDAADRKASLLDGVAVELEPDRHRYEREGVGQPVANLQVGVV